MGIPWTLSFFARTGNALLIVAMAIVALTVSMSIGKANSYIMSNDSEIGMFDMRADFGGGTFVVQKTADAYEDAGIPRSLATGPQGCGITGLLLTVVGSAVFAVGSVVVVSENMKTVKAVVVVLDVLCAVLFLGAAIAMLVAFHYPANNSNKIADSYDVGPGIPLFFASFAVTVGNSAIVIFADKRESVNAAGLYLNSGMLVT